MLDSIRKLFTGDTAQTGDSEAALHLAAAILLIEVAKSDRAIDDEEIVRLRETLKRDWQLNEADLDGLMDVAQDASDTKLSLNQHIDLINRNFSAARKLDLFRSLWQAACADGDIHHREEVFIQRLADLLEVPQDELIRARKWALDSEKGE
ncbi:MAG: TerB family tellurite resistance protein [Sedimenticolaceae bacterium]